MIGSCSNALISSSIASLQRVTDRTPENRISILNKWNSNRQTKICANDCISPPPYIRSPGTIPVVSPMPNVVGEKWKVFSVDNPSDRQSCLENGEEEGTSGVQGEGGHS